MVIENDAGVWRDEMKCLAGIRYKAEIANIEEIREIRRELETTLAFLRMCTPKKRANKRKRESEFIRIGEITK